METKEQAEDRERLRRYVEREGLTSFMNDTKWQRLFKSLEELQGGLDFRRKDVREASDTESHWDRDIYHVFGGCENIEWLDIRAQVAHRQGALAAPKIEDRTQKLVAAAHKAGVRFSLNPDGIRVWGYIRPGTSPEWT